MTRRPFALALVAVFAAAACFDINGSSLGSLFLHPILDSLFVGDSGGPDSVILISPTGQNASPGTLTWSVAPTTVATINPATGVFHAVGKGQALITATSKSAGNAAQGLLVVSTPLDLTLLMDTVFLMPGDTYHIPVAVIRKSGTPADTVRFTPGTSALFTIDSTGFVTAASAGSGPYQVRVRSGPDSVVATGGVVVVSLGSLAGGRFFLTAVGANTRHEGGAAVALQYANPSVSGALVFLLTDTIGSPSDTALYERLLLARPESISTAPVLYPIDSVNPQEAAVVRPPLNIICNPPRVWAIWQAVNPLRNSAVAYSHPLTAGTNSGSFSVTQRMPVAGSYAISGRYRFTAQRGDFYYDPNGVVTFTGTFVAPLVSTTCPAAP